MQPQARVRFPQETPPLGLLVSKGFILLTRPKEKQIVNPEIAAFSTYLP
jgi:hypothetical protein